MQQSSKRSNMRSSLIFLTGLVVAAAMALSLDTATLRVMARESGNVLVLDDTLKLREPTGLGAVDLAAGRTAWDYFRRNTVPDTGLVNSVEDFPSTTMWDQGAYLMALVSAHRLGLVTTDEATGRATRFLTSLGRLPLFDGKLPNKAYDTRSLRMVDYANEETERGIGWSALDVARLLLGLRVLETEFPALGPDIRRIVAEWDLAELTRNGRLYGMHIENGRPVLGQEGRIGYEQYGARAAALWGADVLRAISAERIVAFAPVEGIEVPTDTRKASAFGAITPVLSEPYVLLGLELGFDDESRRLSARILSAMKRRFERTGVLTMVSEDHVDRPPYFLYASVYANGRPWAVVSDSGEPFPELRTQSVKAAFAWDALVEDDYTSMARSAIETLGHPGRGWPAGRYEATGAENAVFSLNTNAVVLEALHYQAFGPLMHPDPEFVLAEGRAR